MLHPQVQDQGRQGEQRVEAAHRDAERIGGGQRRSGGNSAPDAVQGEQTADDPPRGVEMGGCHAVLVLKNGHKQGAAGHQEQYRQFEDDEREQPGGDPAPQRAEDDPDFQHPQPKNAEIQRQPAGD